jgi:ubiquinone/menaquinone biosynthesis C-methylase UbiE
MLHGRKPMMTRLFVEPEREGKVVMVDLGGGTGANIEFLGSAIEEGWFKKVVVLDLAPSLCEVARKRAAAKWPGTVSVVCGDACDPKASGLPAAGTCDIVTISYGTRRAIELGSVARSALLTYARFVLPFRAALVMIPDWKAAIANALRLLRPGGHLCVCAWHMLRSNLSHLCTLSWFAHPRPLPLRVRVRVPPSPGDFTVLPDQGQWALSQRFWTSTFAKDHVHLKVEHRLHLKEVTEPKYEETGFGPLPYTPLFLRAGWYAYVGVKK